MDRRTKALRPGALAVLEIRAAAAPGRWVTDEPASQGSRRDVLDRDFRARWSMPTGSRAPGRRWKCCARLHDAPFYRLRPLPRRIGLPGLAIDRFGDFAVMQHIAAWAEDHAGMIADALG